MSMCFGLGRKKNINPSLKIKPIEIEEHLLKVPQQTGTKSDDNEYSQESDIDNNRLYEKVGLIDSLDYRNPIATEFNERRLRYFLDQDVNRIRENCGSGCNTHFDDFFFLKYICSIVENTESLLFMSLKARLRASSDDPDELNSLIKWSRIEEIANHNRNRPQKVSAQFVLDERGKSPSGCTLTESDYIRFFSVDDIFQGWLGNCFHVGAMMALTRTPDLLKIIIPEDNLEANSRLLGVYHFRFWRLGVWYDVCIDDYLPTSAVTGELLFSRNSLYPNEFWVPLFEKAFAKFMGSYDELECGLFENSALYLSGGLHQEFRTHISQKLASPNLDGSQLNEEEKFHPNIDDLFQIIRIALKKADMVGCILEDDEMAFKYGLYKERLYLISQVFVVEKSSLHNRFVKLHNPFNTRERIKNSEKYVELEAKLKAFGATTTKDGEFWSE